MKKLLPKTRYNPKGFTLIELLIVVTVIAIIAAIGYAVYAGLYLQPKSRNDRRKADIDAIAKAFEVHKVADGNYIALAVTQFSSGAVPIDPVSTSYAYCVTNLNTEVDLTNPTAVSGATCGTITGGTAANWTAAAAGAPGTWDATHNRWKVCASLEDETGGSTRTVYCRRSAQ